MKFKHFLATALALVTCFSFLTCGAYAETAAASAELDLDLVEKADNGFELDLNSQDEVLYLDEITNPISGDDLVDVFSEESGISLYAENTAPVAGLNCIVYNPESLLNGNVTTETTLIWVWKDATNLYTYDPDGDEIASRNISGIDPSYVTGTVSLGEEVVGFTTKIAVAAEHTMSYYVTDSRGAQSNVVRYNLKVEPSDGNTRPVCDIRVSKLSPFVNTNVIFDWSHSTDADGDTLTQIQVQVDDGFGYTAIGEGSPYYVDRNNTSITLTFDQIRRYTVRFSICDSKNAWSDWAEGYIDVQDDTPISLKLNCPFWADSKTVSWKDGNTTARHTLTSRLASVYVYSNYGIHLSEYTNKNGTYYDVMMYPVAPGTHFFCDDTTRTASGTYGNGLDPFWGRTSNRPITAEEVLDLKEQKKINCIIFDAINGEVGEIVDFYSVLNPIIAYGWSKPTYVIG